MTLGSREALWWTLLTLIALTSCSDEGLKDLGDVCTTGSDCASGRCDEQVCKASSPAGPNQPCSHPFECRSENCKGGVCGPGTRELGQLCSHDLQCAKGTCIVDRCSMGPDGGRPDSRRPDTGGPDSGGPDGGPDGGIDASADGWSDLKTEGVVSDQPPPDLPPTPDAGVLDQQVTDGQPAPDLLAPDVALSDLPPPDQLVGE